MKLMLVTGNRYKVLELKSMASMYGLELEPTNVPKVEIQSESLEVIAVYAALTALQYVNKPLLVEDAGLFIEALNGFPGPYSSFVYRKIGIEGILKLMEGSDNRRAYFKSVIAFASPDYGVKVFKGVVYGTITNTARGSGGFGFDPIFIPDGSSKTFAEMDLIEKNNHSHRGKAFREFSKWFINNF